MRERELKEKQGEGHVVHSGHHRWDFLVALVCVLLAFLVWLCVMNVRDTEHVTLEVKDQRDGYVYDLSSGTIEIEGNLVALKRVDAIEVVLPINEEGTYVITEEFLVVPDGISLTGNTRLTVTVTKQ